MHWTITKKIGIGLTASCLLILICGLVGFHSMEQMRHALEYITGRAWDTADGAMEGTIEIEAQIIAVQNITRNMDSQKAREKLDSAHRQANLALNRMKQAALIDDETIAGLDRHLNDYNQQKTNLLHGHRQLVDIRTAFHRHSLDFVSLSDELEAIGDKSVEQLESHPDSEITWNNGLREKWEAADGGMESFIGYLRQLYHLEQMERGMPIDDCVAGVTKALAFQIEASDSMLATGRFDVPAADTQDSRLLSERYRDSLSVHRNLVEQYIERFREFSMARSEYEKSSDRILTFLADLEETADGMVEGKVDEMAETRRLAMILLFTAIGGCLLTSVAGGFGLIHSIVQPLKKAIQTLTESGGSVESGARQISASSQSIADGASSSAAFIEETSASLEEVSGMTRQNAEHAGRARTSATQAREAAEAGVAGLSEMEQAMNDIQASTNDIMRIVQSIDEIAFQTNILALNAAVEAARAGEAGMGFAVVADEVRNLAQRCAKAAHETSDLIEESIGRSRRGVEISRNIGSGISTIAERNREVDSMIAEIAGACAQQKQGIEQISSAIHQLERQTQSNAATAEESAAASTQLHAESNTLREMVNQLQRLIARNHTTSPSRKVATRTGPNSERISSSHLGNAQPSYSRANHPQPLMN